MRFVLLINEINKKRILFIVILTFIVGSLSGCWDKEEIDQRAIIAGVGIDKNQEEEGIHMTVQVIIPDEVQKQSAKQSAVWIGTVTGTSAFDAARNLTLKTGSKALWSHCRMLVVGEEAAKSGVSDFIDWFERDHELRRRTYLLISKGEAKDIIEARTGRERVPAFDVVELLDTGYVTSKVLLVDLHHFFSLMSSKTACAVVPGIEIYTREDIEGEKNRLIRASGSAIFKDYKLQAWIDDNETRGMMWVLNQVKNGVIEVENLLDNGRIISLEILRSKTKIKPHLKDDEISITIEIKEEGNIGGTPIPSSDLSNPENIKKIEERKEEAIKKEVEHIIKKAQDLNTDIFDFGRAIYRKYPQVWKSIEKEWDEIFPTLKVNVIVDAKIRRSGLIMNEPK
ncbi:MAG: Ger(x)C family spore germination protein [Peptostreptococcales bacterium]